MAIDARGPFQQQRTRQPARARSDFDDRAAFENAGGARDTACQVEVEDEILTQALLGAQVEGADDFAQGRQAVGTGPGGVLSLTVAHDGVATARAAAMAEAIFNASMRLRADARPSAAMSNAVP